MKPHNRPTTLGGKHCLFSALFSVALAFGAGCNDGDDGEDGEEDGGTADTAGETGGGEPELCKSSCQDCEDLMKNAYTCNPRDEDDQSVDFECIVCEDDPVDANNNCASAAAAATLSYSYLDDPNLLACDHLTAASCAGWDPRAAVTEYGDGTDFDVDAAFVANLVADPSQLTDCDAARVERRRGVYRVTGASEGDFLYAIGLRDGDAIRSINQHAMTGPFAAVAAFYELWPELSTASIAVDVSRPKIGDISITIDIL
jgi:hypothetical protein